MEVRRLQRKGAINNMLRPMMFKWQPRMTFTLMSNRTKYRLKGKLLV